MSPPPDNGSPRKGRLSAFALLKSWLFGQRNSGQVHNETEFLNTRDGYELGKFAKKAFGNDAEAQRAKAAAVEAEQAEIDALLQGTGAIPMPPVAAPASPPASAKAAAGVDQAVEQLERLRTLGFSVETLAEALIVIESREARQRAARAA